NAAPQLATEIDGAALIGAGTHRDAAAPDAANPAVDASARVSLRDYAFRSEVEAQYARYLHSSWRAWADAESERRRLANLYVGLFTLHQELAGALVEGQLELVWGMALCTARKAGSAISYPLITQTMELSFNPETQAAELRPRDIAPRVEVDVFFHADTPAWSNLEKEAEQFLITTRDTLSPFAPASIEPLLDLARRTFESAAQQTGEPNQCEISSSWVLFARPRSSVAAVQDLERFRDQLSLLDNESSLPQAVAALVTEPSSLVSPAALPAYRGVTAAYHAGAAQSTDAQDLFFPKPFNDEQARIVQMLEISDGVVVQGPPGTGKTHTIANIICHWLANGRRVLVTSMRDPALAVL